MLVGQQINHLAPPSPNFQIIKLSPQLKYLKEKGMKLRWKLEESWWRWGQIWLKLWQMIFLATNKHLVKKKSEYFSSEIWALYYISLYKYRGIIQIHWRTLRVVVLSLWTLSYFFICLYGSRYIWTKIIMHDTKKYKTLGEPRTIL